MSAVVWHLSYYNAPLRLRGVVVLDSEGEAVTFMNNLAKWETFVCMEVTGPHSHTVPE